MFGMKSEVGYEELRARCIETFGRIYKDSLVFDICMVDKRTRLRIQSDEVYIRETKALKANLFLEQLDVLDRVLAGEFGNPERPQDTSQVVLKALEMKNKLLLEDLNVNKDESNALNVTYVAYSREDFEAEETVEVSAGGAGGDLGADFGAAGGDGSFESRMKGDVAKRLESISRDDMTAETNRPDK